MNTVICDDFLPCEPGSFRNTLTGKCDTCLSSREEEHHYIDGYCTGYDIVETDPTSCVPCTEDCGPNAYRLGCEKHSSGFCQAATECTIGLSFEIETLTSFADRSCRVCSACRPFEYVSSVCNGTFDTVCQKLSVCSDFEYESVRPTAYTDRVCEPIERCDFAQEYQILHDAPIENPICLELTTCDTRSFQDREPTNTTDRECAGKSMCLNSQYIQNDGTNLTDTVCAPLSVCGADQFEEIPYSSHSDRVCTACSTYDSKSIVETYGTTSHATSQWNAFCAKSSETDWNLIAIVLSSLFFLLGIVIYVKRFRGDVAVYVGDANKDSKIDVADIIAKFDLNGDGKLSAEETDALLQYTKDSVEFHNSLMKMFCPCFVTRPESLRIVRRRMVKHKEEKRERYDDDGSSSGSDDDGYDKSSARYSRDKSRMKASEH